MYLVHPKNLPLRTLKFLLPSHVVPELGFGDDGVLSENSKSKH